MIRKNIRSDVSRHHPFVSKLIIAAESGEVAKVKRLLHNAKLSGTFASAASLALGTLDPLENATLSAHRLWGCMTPHKAKKKRPNKRSLRTVWQRISRSIGLLLEAGADPNSVDHEGCSVLCQMVAHTELTDIVLRLLCSGANPNSYDASGANALFLAVMWENEEAVRLLLKYGADPGTQFDGNTPLIFAAYNQQPGIVQKLIHAGVDLNYRDKDGRTALMQALYRRGDHPFLVVYRWAREADARHYKNDACFEIVRLLLNSGAQYEAPDNRGFLPIDYALVAHVNGVALPEELAVNQTCLRLCEAAMAGDSQNLTGFLESKEIPSRILSIALTLVAVRGYEECCRSLLEGGADANKINLYGITPANAAATGLQLPIMRLLVAHGLSKDELNVALKGLCMSLSHYYEYDEKTYFEKMLTLARYLLEQGADPNIQDEDLGDLLTIATLLERNVELVKLLREFGAGTVPS